MLNEGMDAEPVGLLIGAVRRRIKQALASHLHRYQLTTQQFWTLVAIYEHPGFSLGELATHLRMDKPTASRVVFTLINRKLVQARDDVADRRRALLHLEVPGAALGRDLRQLATAVRAAVVQGLSPAELASLRTFLRKIIANMDHFQNGEERDRPIATTHPHTRRRRPAVAVPTTHTKRPQRPVRRHVAGGR